MTQTMPYKNDSNVLQNVPNCVLPKVPYQNVSKICYSNMTQNMYCIVLIYYGGIIIHKYMLIIPSHKWPIIHSAYNSTTIHHINSKLTKFNIWKNNML